MSDIATLSATEAARRVRAGALSAVELAEAMLERVAAREPVVRAFTHLDPALWRRQAAAVDAAVKAGRAGALAGLAFGVKDVLDTGDQPSQYGSPIWAGHRPRTDAACVALARRAGAVIAGKTVTTEFATRFPGPTTNPHDPAHTPGGSSQGSAAGVAAGMLHLAFGTQTAGSIIRPAAYCGAHGHKPTYGTVHRGGMKVMSESLDTIGVMARGFDDVALAMGAVSAFDHGRPSERPDRAPRILVTPGVMPDALSPETRALLDRAAAACAARGATVQALDLPGECRRAQELHPVVMHGESAEALASERAMAAMLLSPGLREKLAWGEARGGAALA
ncbi:MAG: amidase, partial [Acetobacteraceae bacterium]|nr:amidase [Acetobacteraceae bacterium]